MAALAWIDAEVLLGDQRMGARSSSAQLDLGRDDLDVTTLTSGGARQRIAGLHDGSLNIDGYVDVEAIEVGGAPFDAALFGNVATNVTRPFTVASSTAALSPAYVGEALQTSLDMFGSVGDVAPFTVDAALTGRTGRGVLLQPASVVSAGGTSTAWVHGALAAGREVVVAVHVLTVTGTTPALTVTVQRDDNAGFATPITVASLGPVSAPTSLLTRVQWPTTTDDRMRVSWTLTGTTPTARFAVGVGLV
jgi:hypothetical protein